MDSGSVTTPFGRRSMTFAMLASQASARDVDPDRSVDKWKIYRALCEAKPLLGITDRALAVLNALLSFYPHNEIAEANGLVVFPSNTQLSLRSHGMAEQTIRRHLAKLIEIGLLIRKDSPNGKRYARRQHNGQLGEVFGFSLAPLLARAEEIESMAAAVVADRLYLQQLKERLSLCRRDLAKLINLALSEGSVGDWQKIHEQFRAVIDGLPRSPIPAQILSALGQLELLRSEIVKILELQLKTQNPGGNGPQNERHIQDSDPYNLIELEPARETAEKRNSTQTGQTEDRQNREQNTGDSGLKAFPLSFVLQACPEISAYGPGGAIGSWRELMTAAVRVSSMLGVSPSAYEKACVTLGPQTSATIIACLLERAGHIASPGGYLRDLTRRAERGEFSIGPMLMALARSNLGLNLRAG